MRLLSVITLSLAAVIASAALEGIDVSVWQPDINWSAVKANGVEFAYIKATEGMGYKNPEFSSQYTGATNVGIIRGGYHLARPNISSGSIQASFFLDNGGNWTPDGITLPGAVEMLYNSDGDMCYDLSASAMVSWIRDFSSYYSAVTGRYPVISTTTDWWTTCTGNYAGFANNHPLWVARHGSSIGTIPAGWVNTTFWQYADSGPNPGFQDIFNGDSAGLGQFVGGATDATPEPPEGIDVSVWQPDIDWSAVKANGIEFAYVKATEGTGYTNPEFSSQFNGATNVGIFRGGYHLARPNMSSGAIQATFFLANGGEWTADGITLPGAVEMLYNSDGDMCYNFSASFIVSWIGQFSYTYHARTGRYPVISTTTDWWTTCTGNYAGFANNNPLWVARHGSSIGTIPAGWANTTFWQYADSGPNPGFQDIFNGDSAGLRRLAQGS